MKFIGQSIGYPASSVVFMIEDYRREAQQIQSDIDEIKKKKSQDELQKISKRQKRGEW